MRVLVISRENVLKMLLTIGLLATSFIYMLSGGLQQSQAARTALIKAAQGEEVVALCIDVMWEDDQTPDILSLLQQREVEATFFVTGYWADGNRTLLRDIARSDMTIGNLSSSYLRMPGMSDEQVRTELEGCSRAVMAVCGVQTAIFRAPYEQYDERLLAQAQALAYDVAPSDIAVDTKSARSQAGLRRLLAQVQPGDILSLRSDLPDAAQTLATILDELADMGYRVVSAEQIIQSRADRAPHTDGPTAL